MSLFYAGSFIGGFGGFAGFAGFVRAVGGIARFVRAVNGIAEFIGAVQGNSGFPGKLTLYPLGRLVPLLLHAREFLLPFLECGS